MDYELKFIHIPNLSNNFYIDRKKINNYPTAEIIREISIDEAKNMFFDHIHYKQNEDGVYEEKFINKSLYDIWHEEKTEMPEIFVQYVNSLFEVKINDYILYFALSNNGTLRSLYINSYNEWGVLLNIDK